jgi:RNA ligase (TIGR02306 family)
MRSLATVRVIETVEAIPNADKIEVVSMKDIGWTVVVKKGQVKVGDTVVYFEIDSALPIDARFEFLRSTSYKCWKSDPQTIAAECFRLKTIKLRGVISQGLVLPVTDFPEIKNAPVGTDVTEILKVKHYDELKEIYEKVGSGAGATSGGNTKGSFPAFIPKSDQTRIQNLMSYFTEHKDTYFTAEAKYDGSSCTVYMVDKKFDVDQFGVCSRNLNLKRPATTKWELVKEALATKCYPHNPIKRIIKRVSKAIQALRGKVNVPTSDFWNIINRCKLEIPLRMFFEETGRSIALQGEYVGPGVNGNRDKYTEHHYFIYDIYDVDKQRFMDAEERHEIINILKYYNTEAIIEEVDTIVDKIQIFKECANLENLLIFVDRKTLRGNKLEGVVFKSIGMDPYFSFKCINNKYLLEEK